MVGQFTNEGSWSQPGCSVSNEGWSEYTVISVEKTIPWSLRADDIFHLRSKIRIFVEMQHFGPKHMTKKTHFYKMRSLQRKITTVAEYQLIAHSSVIVSTTWRGVEPETSSSFATCIRLRNISETCSRSPRRWSNTWPVRQLALQ